MNKKDAIYNVVMSSEQKAVLTDATENKTKTDRIGWKGAYIIKLKNKESGYLEPYPVLVKLRIPYNSRRTVYCDSDFERYAKHRCDALEVLGFYSYYTGKELEKPFLGCPKDDVNAAYSLYSDEPIYIKGHLIFPDSYDINPFVCSNGIHYFYEKESALIYMDWQCDSDFRLRKNCYWKFRKD